MKAEGRMLELDCA